MHLLSNREIERLFTRKHPISERLSLCAYASSASIGTVVIAYVYHDASPDTLAWCKLVFSSRNRSILLLFCCLLQYNNRLAPIIFKK